MHFVVTKEDQERQQQMFAEQIKRMTEGAEQRRKAREAHDAMKCPHCGRNDPLPPWL